MQALHHENDCALFLVIEARYQRGSVPVVYAVPDLL